MDLVNMGGDARIHLMRGSGGDVIRGQDSESGGKDRDGVKRSVHHVFSQYLKENRWDFEI